jgi:hypothetical protein
MFDAQDPREIKKSRENDEPIFRANPAEVTRYVLMDMDDSASNDGQCRIKSEEEISMESY